jgi:uncharacterized protein YozE (UPF0346 family)
MKYIKKYKNDNYTINIVFDPSGEIIRLTDNDFEILSDYIEMNFDEKIQMYKVDDDLRNVVYFVLGENEY